MKKKSVIGGLAGLAILAAAAVVYVAHEGSSSSAIGASSLPGVSGSVNPAVTEQRGITSAESTDHQATEASDPRTTAPSHQPGTQSPTTQSSQSSSGNPTIKNNAATSSTASSSDETFPNSSFAVSKGGTTKTYGASSITYTFNIFITPTYAKFGNPTINARLSGSPGYDNYACQNRGAVSSKVFDSSRSISMQCMVNRVYPSEPGQSPAPLSSQAIVRIYVDGETSTGVLTNGGLLEYVLDYDYDR